MKKRLLSLVFLFAFIFSFSQTIEIVGKGVVGETNSNIALTNIGEIEKVEVGAIYKALFDDPLPSPNAVTFNDADESPFSLFDPLNYDYSTLNNFPIGLFSATFNTADAGGVNAVINADHVESFYAFVYRQQDPSQTFKSFRNSETVFFFRNGIDNPYVFDVPIDVASDSRNIVVHIPVSELDLTIRKVVINITAGPVSLNIEESFPNLGESFFLGSYPLNGVPGDVNNVSISVYSPDPADGPLSNGDSFFVSGVVVDVDKVMDNGDCGECDGQITSLDLKYLGNETDATIKVYQGKVNDDDLFATFTGVNNGDVFSFVGPKKDNKMGSKIFLTVNDGNPIEIHTSCSQDIYAGMEIADTYLIVAGMSHNGGPLCPDTPPGDDDDDDGNDDDDDDGN
ncbi:MAG: hypothetical protein HKN90_00455, partial [Flavobacteriaceae bacterium]|nr:hypothetical protein [Flavobacteriaceae bacterium]